MKNNKEEGWFSVKNVMTIENTAQNFAFLFGSWTSELSV
jgi:hypothetical protein